MSRQPTSCPPSYAVSLQSSSSPLPGDATGSLAIWQGQGSEAGEQINKEKTRKSVSFLFQGGGISSGYEETGFTSTRGEAVGVAVSLTGIQFNQINPFLFFYFEFYVYKEEFELKTHTHNTHHTHITSLCTVSSFKLEYNRSSMQSKQVTACGE